MKELLFDKPIFNKGLNVTVRRGVKWAEEKEVLIDFGHGGMTIVPISTRVMRFCDLNELDLISEHDPECRNILGLERVMHNLYVDFDVREIVTLVEFEL